MKNLNCKFIALETTPDFIAGNTYEVIDGVIRCENGKIKPFSVKLKNVHDLKEYFKSKKDNRCEYPHLREDGLKYALVNDDKNPYWDRITGMYLQQREKGKETYGQTLEENDVPRIIERIEYAQEEMIDFLMYCEWIKEKMKENGVR